MVFVKVDHELDTQNFEKFDEDTSMKARLNQKRYGLRDPEFIGYTYKNYEASTAPGDNGMVQLKKKGSQRASLFQPHLQQNMHQLSLHDDK